MMKNFREYFLWGLVLWIIGYILGIIFFAFIPHALIGWVIMPIGILVTIWVVLKKITKKNIGNLILLGISWTVIAIVCDYLFLVQLFKPADGYYKPDVYVYYILICVLPVIVGLRKKDKV